MAANNQLGNAEQMARQIAQIDQRLQKNSASISYLNQAFQQNSESITDLNHELQRQHQQMREVMFLSQQYQRNASAQSVYGPRPPAGGHQYATILPPLPSSQCHQLQQSRSIPRPMQNMNQSVMPMPMPMPQQQFQINGQAAPQQQNQGLGQRRLLPSHNGAPIPSQMGLQVPAEIASQQRYHASPHTNGNMLRNATATSEPFRVPFQESPRFVPGYQPDAVPQQQPQVATQGLIRPPHERSTQQDNHQTQNQGQDIFERAQEEAPRHHLGHISQAQSLSSEQP